MELVVISEVFDFTELNLRTLTGPVLAVSFVADMSVYHKSETCFEKLC